MNSFSCLAKRIVSFLAVFGLLSLLSALALLSLVACGGGGDGSGNGGNGGSGGNGAPAQSVVALKTTTFRVPLVYGYQADPMMTYWNGYYYLYVDDKLGFDRIRKSASLADFASTETEVIYVGTGAVHPSVGCVYMFHWQSHWYQYCGDGGPLVLKRVLSH